MANGGDLQRILHDLGASRVKVDSVMRTLRAEGLLATEGRGPFARDLTQQEVAITLIAYLGSSKAVSAVSRYRVLSGLQNQSSRRSLYDALFHLLEPGSAAQRDFELRISRTSSRAVIEFDDGEREIFVSETLEQGAHRVRSEGVIDGQAVAKISAVMEGASPARRRRGAGKKKLPRREQ